MLTGKQQQLLLYINKHLTQNGVAPSFEEMKRAVNLKSKSGIHRLITSLEERGFIKRLKHKARAMAITKSLGFDKDNTNETNKSIINYDDDLNKETKEPIKTIKINSSLIIGEGATIKGVLIEENEITVKGAVDGDIQCKNLIVGKTGSIKGKIKADTLYVEGSIEGEINVKELLKLMSSSYVSGKMSYGSLQINEGGKLLGELEFKDKNIIQEEFKDWKTI